MEKQTLSFHQNETLVKEKQQSGDCSHLNHHSKFCKDNIIASPIELKELMFLPLSVCQGEEVEGGERRGCMRAD